MSVRRKKIVVSIEEKLCAIKRLDSGESAKQIAIELGVNTFFCRKLCIYFLLET